MSTYEYVYNVGLLDDLHNYFPAFLYDSGRFQTPVQVFHYFRTELHARFNLPGYGARLAGFQRARATNTTVIPPVSTVPARNVTTVVENPNVLAALAGLLDLSGSFLGDGSYFYMQPHRSSIPLVFVQQKKFFRVIRHFFRETKFPQDPIAQFAKIQLQRRIPAES